MKAKNSFRILAEITAYQWGMVTSARACLHGITRLDLSHLAADCHLERVAHGGYRNAGVPEGTHRDLQAAWLSTDPKPLGEDRLANAAGGVVVAGESAADPHGIGNSGPSDTSSSPASADKASASASATAGAPLTSMT